MLHFVGLYCVGVYISFHAFLNLGAIYKCVVIFCHFDNVLYKLYTYSKLRSKRGLEEATKTLVVFDGSRRLTLVQCNITNCCVMQCRPNSV